MLQKNLKNRTIFCKDNIETLEGINSNSIDLIYLDPPFNKNKIFAAPIGSSAEGASFKDIFREEDLKEEWIQTIKEDNEELFSLLHGIKNMGNRYNFCYLCYMAIRLVDLRRILKSTGSLYLHCDSTMSHYLKIVLDCIFGEENFRNEIVWKRTTSAAKGSQFAAKSWGANTDIIFYYTKTDDFQLLPLEKIDSPKYTKEIENLFPKIDSKGEKYNTFVPLYCSKSMGARPNLCYEWRGFKNLHPSGWRLSKERMEEEYKKGNIVIGNGKIERRQYFKDYKGIPLGNLWSDIANVRGSESTGYPTQKPLALMHRIIAASSEEGDIVLDPFCGCATTCVASEMLKRKWIGVDVSVKAFELVKKRLKKEIKPDLLDPEKEVSFSTEAPKRTDLGEKTQNLKWVYVISNPAYKGEYKVGIAKDWQARLNSYQTADPDRAYSMEYKKETPLFREIEKHIHSKFENNHEWVKLYLLLRCLLL